MGLLIGLIVGYFAGARAGDKRVQEIKEAWETIRTSEETRALVAGGLSMARELVGRGVETMGGRLQNGSHDGAGSVTALRPTG